MALSLDSWWQLIEDARTKAGTPTGHDDGAPFIAALKTSLTKASEDDLVTFQLTFDRLLDDSYTWPLWGVAFIMKGGCSDDAFVSFRGWLVAQGKTTFEAAVKDPQSIGDVVKPGGTYELEPGVLGANVKAGEKIPRGQTVGTLNADAKSFLWNLATTGQD